MGWISGIVILSLVFAAVWFLGPLLFETDIAERRILRLVALPVYMICMLLLTAACSSNVIQAGEVGVVYQFGSIVGQKPAGFQLTAPWQSVTKQSVQVQKFTNTGDKDAQYVGFSSDTQDVFLRATLNYQASPDAVQGLLRNVGTGWFNKLVGSRVANFLKEETVKYTIADMGTNREKIRLAVRDRLTTELAPYSITVNDFLIDNIDYDQSFKDSILAKNKAIQDAEAAQNKVLQSKAEADQAVAVATGQANAAVALATGQAQANDLLNKSLTPSIIQYAAINKLSPSIQVALIPSGQGLLIDPSTFLSPANVPAR